MANTYRLIQDFADVAEDAEGPDSIAVNPVWILAVVRLSKPITFSRASMKSVDTDSSGAIKQLGETLIITGDCINLSITGDKSSHLKNLNGVILQSNTNYLFKIKAGDWVLAWIVNSEEKAADLIERIKAGEACNRFDDGFKFVGRVNSFRKRRRVNTGSGSKTATYQLQATAFKELDSQVFYDPYLALKDESIGHTFARLGRDINDFLSPCYDSKGSEAAAVDINKVIPFFLDLLVGRGVPRRFGNPIGAPELDAVSGGAPPEGLDVISGLGTEDQSKEAPFAYVVPETVGKLLGRTQASKSGGILSYADLLDMLFGIQHYSGAGLLGGQKYAPLIPTIKEDHPLTTANHRFTGSPLMGLFIPTMPNFTNRPVWTILHDWLNPSVNEIYTCFRVNDSGNVVPTIVVRQYPFTTDIFQQNHQDLDVTKFLDVPRWLADDVLVWEDDFGVTDSTRINFVHVYGTAAMSIQNNTITRQVVLNPPIRDDLDIQRNGLRMFMTSVNCSIKDTIENGPRQWMEMVADRVMNHHLTLNGAVQMIGIQAPICEGDNFELHDIVYHIESVSHECQINQDSGMRSFHTTLTLTNGMRSDGAPHFDASDDASIYMGTFNDDGLTADPGLSQDYRDWHPAPDESDDEGGSE